MVLFAGPRNFKMELHGTFACLCDDPNKCVRVTMASGFHEVSSHARSSDHLGKLSVYYDREISIIS